MRLGLILWTCLVVCFGASAARAQPSTGHPRIWLTADVIERWTALATQTDSAVARAIAKCKRIEATPSEWRAGQYQGFAWVEAMSACLVAWKSTDDTSYRDTALVYLRGLLSDRDELEDGNGPSYAGGAGIVAQDSGYSMRTHGVWAALGYDWLYDALSDDERDLAHERFTQWLAFHQNPDSYQRAQPGANYHAGHVLAVTLLAIGHGHEMNQRQAGSGTTLYDYVVDKMWGEVMAGGFAPRAPLGGGDWLEGWQYAPLSVASYALAGRALTEQGVAVPWLVDWSDQLLHRYIHGLAPDDRMFVGGDTGDDTPLLSVNALPLWGVIAGASANSTASAARAELDRLGSPQATDFQLFFEALAEANDVPAVALDRDAEPTAWLAAGAGNFYGRTGFDVDATWMVSQCKGILVDHQHQNAGNIVLSRGADALLVDPGPYGSLSTLTGNAPSMSQPHFNENYRPSQAAWGERSSGLVPEAQATRFVFTRATRSNLLATRCDWDGQLRFQDNPSETVADATRDVVLLPGVTGASLLVIDRLQTTATWSASASPLLVRFKTAGTFAEEADGTAARATVGASRLLVRRLIGEATTNTRAVPQGDCQSSDRGKCDEGRFAASEWRAEIAGPNPFTAHLLDADAADAADPVGTATAQGSLTLFEVERESRRFVVATSQSGAAISGYQTAAIASTHVVVDPPSGERVSVVAKAGTEAGSCDITLSAATGNAGFESRPLAFTLDEDCGVAEETSQPPVAPPGTGGPDGSDGGMGGGAGTGGGAGSGGGANAGSGDGGPNGAAEPSGSASSSGGCGCQTAPRGTSGVWLIALASLAWFARRRLFRA